MVTTLGPPVRRREPVACRTYRHPGTGHEVALVVEREIVGPGDAERLGWWVDLQETPGSPTWMARLRYATLCWTRTQARRAFAERQRALRAAGYKRVD
jgi:hypothetical protein